MVNKLKIAVLRETFSENNSPLAKTGFYILENLLSEKYIVFDVVVTKNQDWYFNGEQILPENFLAKVDFVFNLIEKNFGNIQKLLESFNIRYAGSDFVSSIFSSNKKISKDVYKKEGIKTPYSILLKKENYSGEELLNIFKSVPFPCVVKPVNLRFSQGVAIADNLKQLEEVIYDNFQNTDAVLIEEYIKGKEFSCGVVESFRDKKVYSLLPAEIIKKNLLLDKNLKEAENFETSFSNNLSFEEKKEIQEIAIFVHRLLGLKHYSQSDFIVSPKRGIYLLETNSNPSFSKNSSFVKSLEAVGSDFKEFLNHIINL